MDAPSDPVTTQIVAVLLASLRVAPSFAFAPPFTLLRVPATIRVLLAVAIALWLVTSMPRAAALGTLADDGLLVAIASELALGAILAFSLQWAFGMIQFAGRAVDVQAGFGLALLVDPTSRAQVPLVGTVFAYAAGAVFFLTDGPARALAIWAESVRLVPVGALAYAPDLPALAAYVSLALFLALALAGTALLTLFLIDMTVALMSRTLPQMNVLLLGFQVKTMALLVVLPLSIAYSGNLFLRIVDAALSATPTLYGS